jgi:hypothetical protein
MRNAAARVVRPFYGLFEVLGFHVMPVHFYSPIPPTRDLTDDVFARVSDCVGVDWNLPGQQRYLTEVFPKYVREEEFPVNPGLSPVDAAILHAMIRHHKPRKMVEIGSGFSTQFAARACFRNAQEGCPCELIAIEPYPAGFLKKGFPGLSRLIESKVEKVPLKDVVDCDILFIDSSHVVRIGGDVNYEILELLPRLKTGALVHWHDILLPGEYWKGWVMNRHFFFTEQYLLQAFLQFNSVFEVAWASRYMNLNHLEDVRQTFPFFDPHHDDHHITSFWVRRKS